MSEATKRKHVIKEILSDDLSPPADNQKIVKVLSSKGNNLHEVEEPDSTVYLVSMPTKFRKNVWVKRGDFLIVEPIEEGNKVKAEIVKILAKPYIRFLKNEKLWPEKFNDESNESSDSDSSLIENTNRGYQLSDSSDSSESESDPDPDSAAIG